MDERSESGSQSARLVGGEISWATGHDGINIKSPQAEHCNTRSTPWSSTWASSTIHSPPQPTWVSSLTAQHLTAAGARPAAVEELSGLRASRQPVMTHVPVLRQVRFREASMSRYWPRYGASPTGRSDEFSTSWRDDRGCYPMFIHDIRDADSLDLPLERDKCSTRHAERLPARRLHRDRGRRRPGHRRRSRPAARLRRCRTGHGRGARDGSLTCQCRRSRRHRRAVLVRHARCRNSQNLVVVDLQPTACWSDQSIDPPA